MKSPERRTMFDDLDHLRNSSGLLQLLGHYVELCEPDREAWQDRLMHLEGHEPRDLTKFHGQLLGFGWLEQNTGHTPVLRPEAVPACYRVTSTGLRAFREVQGLTVEARPDFNSENPFPKKKRAKRRPTEESKVPVS